MSNNNFDWEGMMKSFFSKDSKDSKNNKKVELNINKNKSSSGGGFYCLGFIGALVYYMQAAVGFGAVVTGILKSFIWPATLVYKLLEQFYGVVS